MRDSTSRCYLIAAFTLMLSGYYFYFMNVPWSNYWLDGKEFWYSLHWKGEKVGFVQINYDLQDNGVFQVIQLTSVKSKNLGKEVTLTEKEVYHFDTRNFGELVSIFYHHQQDDYLEQISLNAKDGYLQGEKIIADQKIEIKLRTEHYQLAEYLQLMRWSLEQPIIGEILQSRRFDLKELALIPITYEVVENKNQNAAVMAIFQEQGRSWQGTVELSTDGVAQRYAVGNRVVQQLTTKELALSDNSDADYYYSQAILTDRPLGDVAALKSLTLGLGAFPTGFIVSNQRQQIGDNGDLLLTASSPTSASTDDEYQHYLLDKKVNNQWTNDPFSVDTDVLVNELAKSVVGESNKVEDKVVKLLAFVADYLEDTAVIRPMSMATILDQRQGDCTEHTRLFIALARALKIPAREVNGLIYLGDEIQGFGGHVWSEVIIDNGWVAVDPTWNLSQLGATHIQLTAGSETTFFDEMSENANLHFNVRAAEYSKVSQKLF